MKKACMHILSTLVVVASLIACAKKDSGGDGGGTTATTPTTQSCNIPGNSSCTPNVYQQYAPNFQVYQYADTNAFCGCGLGYRPVINPTWGLSCAPDNWFPNSSNFSYYYSYSYNTVLNYTQNNQWTSIPQVTYTRANSGSVNNCMNAAASVCDTRMTNSSGFNPQCASNSQCIATAGGSYVGLCTYSNTGCYRYSRYYGLVNICGYRRGSISGYGYYGAGFNFGLSF